MDDMDNIIKLFQEANFDDSLEKAKGQCVNGIIIGFTESGDVYIGSNTIDSERLVYLCQVANHTVLSNQYPGPID